MTGLWAPCDSCLGEIDYLTADEWGAVQAEPCGHNVSPRLVERTPAETLNTRGRT